MEFVLGLGEKPETVQVSPKGDRPKFQTLLKLDPSSCKTIKLNYHQVNLKSYIILTDYHHDISQMSYVRGITIPLLDI